MNSGTDGREQEGFHCNGGEMWRKLILERRRQRWEYIIKMDIKETG
jgi:hypothetical protein